MRKQIRILTIAFILTLSAVSAFAQEEISRINFKKGATKATVSGTLDGFKDKKVFVITVRQGQTLNTEQLKSKKSSQYITVSIQSPTGAYVGDADASCNNRKEITPTLAGDYKLTVVECGKADEWRGKFKLKITVK